jgi:uncharacterized protein YciI
MRYITLVLWIMYAEDRPGSAALREATKDEHLAYLAAHEHIVMVGGALLEDTTPVRLGSCLIVNLPDRAAAEQWARDEPFNKAGLFQRVSLVRMRKGQLNPAAAPKTAEGE